MEIRLNCTLHYIKDGKPAVANPGEVIDYGEEEAEDLIEQDLASVVVERPAKGETPAKKQAK